MSLQQCMGGWCTQRDKCRHYTAPATPGQSPAERLCGDDAEPELWHAQARRVDDFRAAGTLAIASGNVTAWALHWAGMKPLAVPMGNGTPSRAHFATTGEPA